MRLTDDEPGGVHLDYLEVTLEPYESVVVYAPSGHRVTVFTDGVTLAPPGHPRTKQGQQIASWAPQGERGEPRKNPLPPSP